MRGYEKIMLFALQQLKYRRNGDGVFRILIPSVLTQAKQCMKNIKIKYTRRQQFWNL